jgi:hypothetical protein
MDGHPRAVFGKHLGDGPANAARGTRDQYDFVGKVHPVVLPSRELEGIIN